MINENVVLIWLCLWFVECLECLQITKYFNCSPFNYCFVALLTHALYCHIKLAFFLTIYVFGSSRHPCFLFFLKDRDRERERQREREREREREKEREEISFKHITFKRSRLYAHAYLQPVLFHSKLFFWICWNFQQQQQKDGLYDLVN